MGKQINLWGYSLYSGSVKNMLALLNTAKETSFKRIVTLNPQMVVAGNDDAEKKKWISQADYILPDGYGITWALKRQQGLTLPVQTGVALVDSVLKSGEFSVYLWGGAPDIQSAVKLNISKQYPGLDVVGIEHGYQNDKNAVAIYEDIKEKKPDFIFIGMGYPKQEEIIYELSLRCKKGIAVGVGGVFDILSGKKILAPVWVRACRMEWLYRGFQEPKRMLKWGYLFRYIWFVWAT
jgi:N-acetylglucosaminyldiphosphoundecaprenol N-acetyl-beta-D-mannosaminyltransferase